MRNGPDADIAEALDAALIAAHLRRDPAALVGLYTQAADLAATNGQVARSGFFLTQAYIFALERGDARATELHARLKAMGREE